MPIVQPKTFNTLGVISFNINAHFTEADPKSTHKGETRETRIKEFHEYNNTSVLGLKEGSWLRVLDSRIVLKGSLTASLFIKEEEIQICEPETDFSLLK
jgi:dipeptidase E